MRILVVGVQKSHTVGRPHDVITVCRPHDVIAIGRPHDVITVGRPHDVIDVGRPPDVIACNLDGRNLSGGRRSKMAADLAKRAVREVDAFSFLGSAPPNRDVCMRFTMLQRAPVRAVFWAGQEHRNTLPIS